MSADGLATADGRVSGGQPGDPVVAVLWTHSPDDDRLVAQLAPEEVERAGRTPLASARAEFATGAWLLRTTAARLLGVDELEVAVDRRCASCGGAHGRPRIAGLAGFDASITHAAGQVGIALAAGARVGLDLERVGGPPSEALIGTTCTAAEAAMLETWPRGDRAGVFTALWCRKESVLKAFAVGLRVSPSDVDVLGERPVARQLSVSPDAGRWIPLTSAPHGFQSALFATGSPTLIAELHDDDVEALTRSDDYSAVIARLARALRS